MPNLPKKSELNPLSVSDEGSVCVCPSQNLPARWERLPFGKELGTERQSVSFASHCTGIGQSLLPVERSSSLQTGR